MIYGKPYDIFASKYDMISVPLIREAYIICFADIIALAISSVSVEWISLKKTQNWNNSESFSESNV